VVCLWRVWAANYGWWYQWWHQSNQIAPAAIAAESEFTKTFSHRRSSHTIVTVIRRKAVFKGHRKDGTVDTKAASVLRGNIPCICFMEWAEQMNVCVAYFNAWTIVPKNAYSIYYMKVYCSHQVVRRTSELLCGIIYEALQPQSLKGMLLKQEAAHSVSFAVPGNPLCPNLPSLVRCGPLWSIAIISHTLNFLVDQNFWWTTICLTLLL